MKKVLILIAIVLISCSRKEEVKEVVLTSADSVIASSQNRLDTVTAINERSDSLTKEKVVKIVSTIRYLANEVEKYKTEQVQMLNTQNIVTEKIIYRVDTVYIETEKNFWGRKKTTKSVKSDSLVSEAVLDSSFSTEILKDTIDHY